MVSLGIDVSKDGLDCALLADEGGKPLGRRAFPNDAEGAERVAGWVARASGAAAADTHVILEATAAYHEPVAHRLAALGMRVSIVNPAQVRSFAKGLGILGKTDRIDARLLARYGQLARPKAWQPPAKVVADLQALMARLDDVEADLRREENRLEQARTRGCPDIVERSLLESAASLRSRRQDLRRAIVAHVAAHGELQTDLEQLLIIPAVGPKTAARMLAMLRACCGPAGSRAPGRRPVTNLLRSYPTLSAVFFLRGHVRDIYSRLVIPLSDVAGEGEGRAPACRTGVAGSATGSLTSATYNKPL